MFGLLDNSLWLAQFILELTAAVFAFRHFRANKIFWGYLGFRAAADALTFLLSLVGMPSDLWAAWRWSNYAQLMIQYVWLAILAMRGMGEATNTDERTIRGYSALAALTGIIGIVIAHGAQPWTKEYLLGAGEKADFLLAVIVGGTLLFREFDATVAPMAKPWLSVCWGLLVAVSTDAAARLMWHHGVIGGITTSRLMACGQLVALSVWTWGVLRKQVAEEAQEVMPPLKFEPESLTIEEESYRGWVN